MPGAQHVHNLAQGANVLPAFTAPVLNRHDPAGLHRRCARTRRDRRGMCADRDNGGKEERSDPHQGFVYGSRREQALNGASDAA